MNKNGTKPDFVSLALAAIFLAAMLCGIELRSAVAAELTVIYSSDIRGEIEPCG
ncbi:MAG: hypothetical protein Kow0089_20260 [Desulfobulbaceae bacterium]